MCREIRTPISVAIQALVPPSICWLKPAVVGVYAPALPPSSVELRGKPIQILRALGDIVEQAALLLRVCGGRQSRDANHCCKISRRRIGPCPCSVLHYSKELLKEIANRSNVRRDHKVTLASPAGPKSARLLKRALRYPKQAQGPDDFRGQGHQIGRMSVAGRDRRGHCNRASDGRKIHAAIPSMAARMSAYSESELAMGGRQIRKAGTPSPMSPMASIVCMTFINRHIASRR